MMHGKDALAVIICELILVIFISCGGSNTKPGPSSSSGLTTNLIASGLNRPTFVASLPGNNETLIVLEQHTGLVKLIRRGAVLPRPFLNISDRVITSGEERGLLGLAFDPNYTANGFFYINYIDNSGNTVISRFQVTSDPDSANPASENMILNVTQPYPNHNGGMLAFGPNDGCLYIGLGDGGSEGDPQNRAQNEDELLGKILRIDVHGGSPYAIPPTNPFAGVSGKRPEIWAFGLRNPWRFSFDSANSNLYIADVGQDSWEEIDFQPASSSGGQNYGWRLMEGTHCFNPPVDCDAGGLVHPIYEYSHSNGCSITGGYVYRGTQIPGLTGTYFFGDYCSARIWSFRYDGTDISNLTERTSELAPGQGQSIRSISSFGVDSFGELYIVDLSGGAIFKIVPPSS